MLCLLPGSVPFDVSSWFLFVLLCFFPSSSLILLKGSAHCSLLLKRERRRAEREAAVSRQTPQRPPRLRARLLIFSTLYTRAELSGLWAVLVSLHYVCPRFDDTKTVSIHSVPQGQPVPRDGEFTLVQRKERDLEDQEGGRKPGSCL